MGRRLAGALLVTAAMIAAVLLPAGGGLRISGSAVPAAVPSPPRAGECLLDPAAGFGDDSIEGSPAPGLAGPRPAGSAQAGSAQAGSAPAGSAPSGPAQAGPAQAGSAQVPPTGGFGPSFGRCSGQPVLGEVVAVVPSVRAAGNGRGGADGAIRCRKAALQYAGLDEGDGRYFLDPQVRDDPVAWRFSIKMRRLWVFPSLVLSSVGQRWAACVVGPSDLGRYDGELADAFRTGRLPDAFGTCWDKTEPAAGVNPVRCGAEHRSELISSGVVGDRASTTAAAIRQSCQALAARVLRRVDPTDGGRLDVRVSPDAADDEAWLTPSMDIACFISAPRDALGGTLVGVGEGPIPYAS